MHSPVSTFEEGCTLHHALHDAVPQMLYATGDTCITSIVERLHMSTPCQFCFVDTQRHIISMPLGVRRADAL